MAILNYECFISDWFAFCMAAFMPGPSNTRAVRGVSSYKYAYIQEKVLCRDPDT